jgi:superfamily I DNA/RNA helicase
MNEFSLPFFTEEDEGNIDREEEEFCLAYVACTRAKKVLRMYMPFMTGSGSWSKTNKMSRYIKNMFLTSGEKYFNFRVLDVHDEIEFKNKILASAMNKAKQ